MPREYVHIQPFKEEILELKRQGFTQREIANRLGFEQMQIKEFFHRYNKLQRRIEAGIPIRKRGESHKES